MSAFAMFALTAPSLLACAKARAEGHLHPIYGMERVPCDTHLRASLDPVSPKGLRPVCTRVFRPLQRGKALEAMRVLDGHYVLALDGTGYCSSQTMHGASCLHQGHRHGAITYSHQLLGAAMLHPDRRAVIPFRPAPMVTQDGTGNNDGERNAAQRCIAKLRHDRPHLTVIVTEDSVRANAPHIAPLHDHGLHDIRGVKAGDHAHLFAQVQAAEHAGRVMYSERHDRAAGVVPRFRFVNDVPLHASNADVRVNCIAYGERGNGQTQPCSWGTDLRVSTRTVYHLRRGGRARWKREHETFNTLKNQGDHFEHTYGHGEQHLSVVFAMGMMRALLVDQPQPRGCALFRAVWPKLGSKRLWWERMRALLSADALQSLRQLFETLLYGLKKRQPLWAGDSSCLPALLLYGPPPEHPALPHRLGKATPP